MNPFHAAALDGVGEASHIEKFDLMALDERDDDFGAPRANGSSRSMSTSRSQPVPGSFFPGHNVIPMTPDDAGKVRRRDGGDTQRIGQACLHRSPRASSRNTT
jgi:hypothetical protein